MSEIENKPCHHCGAEPGTVHLLWDSIARCYESGYQLISCPMEHDGDCHPSIWDGEWPGVKKCREYNLYTAPDSFWGVIEDLNQLYARGVWDRDKQEMIIPSLEKSE